MTCAKDMSPNEDRSLNGNHCFDRVPRNPRPSLLPQASPDPSLPPSLQILEGKQLRRTISDLGGVLVLLPTTHQELRKMETLAHRQAGCARAEACSPTLDSSDTARHQSQSAWSS